MFFEAFIILIAPLGCVNILRILECVNILRYFKMAVYFNNPRALLLPFSRFKPPFLFFGIARFRYIKLFII